MTERLLFEPPANLTGAITSLGHTRHTSVTGGAHYGDGAVTGLGEHLGHGRGSNVKIRVLGAIEVEDGGERASLSPQLRRLLGVLVAADGRPVSADRLAMDVADGRAEGSTVRTAVSRLRKIVGARIEAADGGYRLVVGDELDLIRFHDLRRRADGAEGDQQVQLLREALALWRGPAFGDHRDEEWAAVTAAAAEQAHAACIEALAEALVECGDHAAAVTLLEPHLADHPYRERPVAVLMQALAGDGRTTDALRVFERFRLELRDDMGLDPSPDLRALELALLDRSAESPGVVGPAPPRGTVTFLFTDIVGSTQRWEADEQTMARELATHDEVIRTAVGSHGGHVFKHTGDGICAAFESASAGVAAALAAQASLALPVRMGLHTGEAELRDGDYYGPTLNRSARIMDAGHGGQVLLSGATAALVDGESLHDLGQHHLKGLESPERVWQVGSASHPPLRAESSRPGNLPSEPSPFVGRTEELDDLTTLIVDHRVVSLIGVGGTGKTRLAIELARSAAPAFPDGCWLVELAETTAPDLVPLAIAAAFGIEESAGTDPLESVVTLLRRHRALVVVDNCEHVLDAAADAVERIVAACPAVSILATSREPLMIAGERLAPTPSLSEDDAVALFLDRARAEAPDLAMDDSQRAAILEICRRLDGLPLAIELAAARLRSMTPMEVERRLDERFRLLVGGRRARVERHRTMAAALDWSYDLCTPDEQLVFARLSVFAGEFGLGDAVAVAVDDDDGLDDLDVERALADLVDRSLVRRVVGADGGSRFRLLETMRAYGHERLVELGEADQRRRRHAHHIDDQLCRLSFDQWGPDEDRARAGVRAMTPEILAAATWSLDREDWVRTYRLGSASTGAAWAQAMAILAQLADAAAATPAVAETLGSLRMRVVADAAALARLDGPTDAFRSRPDIGRHATIGAWLAAEHRTVEDHLGYPVLATIAVAEDIDDLFEFLDGHDGSPTHRCHLEWGLLEAQLEGGALDRLIERLPVVDALVTTIDSRMLRRRVVSSGALILESAGRIEDAARRLEHLVPADGRESHHSEVIIALRHLRIAARAGRPVSGADIRRPWELQARSPGLETATLAVIGSTAVAMDALGAEGLAARLLRQLPPPVRPQFRAMLTGMLGPESQRTLDADDPADETLDAVRADVFRFADER